MPRKSYAELEVENRILREKVSVLQHQIDSTPEAKVVKALTTLEQERLADEAKLFALRQERSKFISSSGEVIGDEGIKLLGQVQALNRKLSCSYYAEQQENIQAGLPVEVWGEDWVVRSRKGLAAINT